MLWNILFFCEKLLHLVEYVNINNNKSSLQWSWLLNNEHTNAMKNVVCSSDHDLFYGLFRSGKRDTWPLKSLGSTPNDYTEVKLNIFIVSYYWISWIIENYFWIPTAQRSCKYSCFLHALDIFFSFSQALNISQHPWLYDTITTKNYLLSVQWCIYFFIYTCS